MSQSVSTAAVTDAIGCIAVPTFADEMQQYAIVEGTHIKRNRDSVIYRPVLSSEKALDNYKPVTV
jgi:hypothetical protein